MKITVVYGQAHRGSTWHWAEKVLERFPGAEVARFYLPAAAPASCIGCMKCFSEGEDRCPHAGAVRPIADALDWADLIVLASPCYVFDVTGAMKTTLDHLAYRWLPHRPRPAMFGKVGLAMATTAGAGARRTAATMRKSLAYWGVPAVYTLTAAVQAAAWDGIRPQKRARMERAADRAAARIRRAMANARTGPGMRVMFYVVRKMMKGKTFSPVDRAHWAAQGWLGRGRPWRA